MAFDPKKKHVELHIHLDGAVRPDTIYEVAKRRKIEIEQKNINEIIEHLEQTPPYSPEQFFKGFALICKVIGGDKAAIEQVCKEFVEDCVRLSDLCHVEVRFAPSKLASKDLNSEAVLKLVCETLLAAAKPHKLGIGVLVCLMRDEPKEAMAIYELAKKYLGKGVVGIDLAGDDSKWAEEKKTADEIVKVFQLAKEQKMHRTVHVGENSPVEAVKEAIDKMHAERIGHGYTAATDAKLMEQVKKAGIHFELCPSSSFMTGSVKEAPCNHPIHKFIGADISYSINTDDPSITGRWLNDEYTFCVNTLCLARSVVTTSSSNAAKAAFIDDAKAKEALLKHVQSDEPDE